MQRETLLTLAVAALLSACTSRTVGPPPPPPVDWLAFNVHRVLDAGPGGPTAKERAVVESYVAAIGAADMSPLAPLLDSSVHFAFPGMSDARGRDAVARAHETLFGAFDSRAFATSRVWRTESAHALEWTMRGVHARDWMGATATHKQVVLKGLTLVWTKDDGSITDVHVYFDTAIVKAALGMGPKNLVALAPQPSVTGAPQVFEQSDSADEKKGVASTHTALDALENNDQAGYVATMTDDVEVYTLEREQPMHSKDDARAYFKAMRKAIGQLDTTVANAWGIGPFVVIEYEIAGDQIASIGWIPPQRDKVIRLHIVDVVEIRSTKIARIWRYDNPAEITVGL